MKKIIKAWGDGGLGVYFDKEDIKLYDLSKDDFIELVITKLANHKS